MYVLIWVRWSCKEPHHWFWEHYAHNFISKWIDFMNNMNVLLDIWNGYIKGVILVKEEGKEVVVAREMVKTKGMRKWKILDVEDFAVCINQILNSFTRKLGEDIVEKVFIGVSHPLCSIKRISEQKRVLWRDISHDDITHLSDVVAETLVKPNFEALKIIPVQWIIDERTKVKDPIGMEARKLELIADVFMIPKNFYENLLQACDQLDLQIVDVVPNILWSIESCLDLDERDLWVLLIDIGANQTSYVVYEEWYPVFHGVLPVWGEEVTKDISIGLQVDIKDAEHIKREKGLINIDNRLVTDDSVDIRFLSDIMLARYEEIFEIINEDLVLHQKDWRLPGWVVLIWWASKVEGLPVLAKDVFKLATFVGKEKNLQLWELSSNQQFINILWVYVWVMKYFQKRRTSFNFSFNIGGGLFRKVGSFFKELF